MVKFVVVWVVADGLFLFGWLAGAAKQRRACEETLVQYARRVAELEDVLAAHYGPAIITQIEQYLQEKDP